MSVSRLNVSAADAAEHVMNKLTDLNGNPIGRIGVFVIDGKVITTGIESGAYQKHLTKNADSMVGTYDAGADYRNVLADLQVFA